MAAISFLAEWAIRSSGLIALGALLVWILRVKDSSTRLAAWIAMLAGSLLIPVMTGMLPNIPLHIMPALTPVPSPLTMAEATTLVVAAPVPPIPAPAPFDWPRAALALYVLVALGMLLRTCVGLLLGFRLIRQSRRTDKTTGKIEIFESSRIPTPVTLGILRPIILLPGNWAEWGEAKLNGVLAHERSHIYRRDPAVQLISTIHRALLWFSPFAWFLHSKIIRAAEEVSDDAAIAAMNDRASYAEILLDFMRCPKLGTGLAGVPMSRYGRADRRLHRILDSTTISRGLTRLGLTAILAIASPLAYILATAQPRNAEVRTAPPVPPKRPDLQGMNDLQRKSAEAAMILRKTSGSLVGLGTVSAAMVTVHPLVNGPLMSVTFREGQTVKAGETLALIDPRGYQNELERAQMRVERDKEQLGVAQERYRAGVEPVDAQQKAQSALQTDEQVVDDMRQQIARTHVTAPVSGVAGLRLVEPGNVVHASDPAGIVVIAQVQPISVLFKLPERNLQQVRVPLEAGRRPVAEAWSPDMSVKLATGVVTAMDNQIDSTEGTIKFRATFDNKDNKLFPSQFVNVRVLLK